MGVEPARCRIPRCPGILVQPRAAGLAVAVGRRRADAVAKQPPEVPCAARRGPPHRPDAAAPRWAPAAAPRAWLPLSQDRRERFARRPAASARLRPLATSVPGTARSWASIARAPPIRAAIAVARSAASAKLISPSASSGARSTARPSSKAANSPLPAPRRARSRLPCRETLEHRVQRAHRLARHEVREAHRNGLVDGRDTDRAADLGRIAQHGRGPGGERRLQRRARRSAPAVLGVVARRRASAARDGRCSHRRTAYPAREAPAAGWRRSRPHRGSQTRDPCCPGARDGPNPRSRRRRPNPWQPGCRRAPSAGGGAGAPSRPVLGPHHEGGLVGQLDAHAARSRTARRAPAVDRPPRRAGDAPDLQHAAAAVVDEMVDLGIVQPALEAAAEQIAQRPAPADAVEQPRGGTHPLRAQVDRESASPDRRSHGRDGRRAAPRRSRHGRSRGHG